jgi:mutator protein MutT
MEVVCAVIKRERTSNNGRTIVEYLIGMCIINSDLEGQWEFIGGKVEEGESHSDAVKRAVMEQVGAEIEIMGLQHPIEHSHNRTKIRLWQHECKLTKNSPDPQDLVHFELAWIESRDMW